MPSSKQAPRIPDRADAATLHAQKVEDADAARSRMIARLIETLSAAGMTCEVVYLGLPLQ